MLRRLMTCIPIAISAIALSTPAHANTDARPKRPLPATTSYCTTTYCDTYHQRAQVKRAGAWLSAHNGQVGVATGTGGALVCAGMGTYAAIACAGAVSFYGSRIADIYIAAANQGKCVKWHQVAVAAGGVLPPFPAVYEGSWCLTGGADNDNGGGGGSW